MQSSNLINPHPPKQFFAWKIIGTSLFITLMVLGCQFSDSLNQENEEEVYAPQDWFFKQRAFPFQNWDMRAYQLAVDRHREQMKQLETRNNEYFWQFAGPTNIGGRITDIELASDGAVYAGAASGGLFRTYDEGIHWESLLDEEGSPAVGDFAVRGDTLYVGTGEANAGGGSLTYDGLGILKSTDGGTTWLNTGLGESGSIGKVEIHPRDPQTVFVAAMGQLFNNNAQRGIFRTKDGGNHWEQVLSRSDSTGGIDVVIHPTHPDTIFAALWERKRTVDNRQYGGATTGLFRSMDGGDTWEELKTGLPTLPAYKGRIGLAIAHSAPDTLYAMYCDQVGYLQGLYRSYDAGNHWSSVRTVGINSPSYMYWYGKVAVSPANPMHVFVTGLPMFASVNGGDTWNTIFRNAHVDQHDLEIDPNDPQHLILGNDGGVYSSRDGGSTSRHWPNLPVTQFYTIEINPHNPSQLYGGTQDNASIRTLTGAPDDWESIYVGDGFYTLIDPVDPLIMYTEYQYGAFAKSIDGGNRFTIARNGINTQDRTNWNTPAIIDPADHQILYLGTYRLYKSIDQANTWFPISEDLTNGPGPGEVTYGTITTIDLPYSDHNVIWVGTDDGFVWITKDQGETWKNVTNNLPKRWVTRVVAHPSLPGVAYVTLSGFRYGSASSHIYRTSDYGETWTGIDGDLPDIPVNDLVVDPNTQDLYIATDIGVYWSPNIGGHWEPLGSGMPTAIITDLDFDSSSQTLAAATYGRSAYYLKLDATTSRATKEAGSRFQAYYQPSKGSIAVESKESLTGIWQCIDLQGHILHQWNIRDEIHSFTQYLPITTPGIYFIRQMTSSGKLGSTKKLWIQP